MWPTSTQTHTQYLTGTCVRQTSTRAILQCLSVAHVRRRSNHRCIGFPIDAYMRPTSTQWGAFDHIGSGILLHAARPQYRAGMGTHTPTEQLLDAAQNESRCAIGATDLQRKALRRRAREGILVNPYRNLYSRVEYWSSLSPPQRHMHITRALTIMHPNWVFAELTAACAYELDHAYSLHDLGAIYIASTYSQSPHQYKRLRRIYMHDIDVTYMSNIPVTDIRRTLIDCALHRSFSETLPLFDSALRKGIASLSIREYAQRLGYDTMQIDRLCTYADPLSENGGESLARATIIELGFIVPRLQRPFMNPSNPNAPLRADFTWELPGGILIVAEFDGMGKYVVDDGTRRSIQARVHAEREREQQLRTQGATTIMRFEFEDLRYPERLERKLIQAGVPKRR